MRSTDRPGKRDVGRAINTTPRRETKAPTCCDRVKGSLMMIQHAAQATLGARKVITVASAMGRYRRESACNENRAQTVLLARASQKVIKALPANATERSITNLSGPMQQVEEHYQVVKQAYDKHVCFRPLRCMSVLTVESVRYICT